MVVNITMDEEDSRQVPLELHAGPVGSPESLINKRISYYLSELSLCFLSIGISHLS